MNNIIKDNWNKWSDEYYQEDTSDYYRVMESPERAFPIELYPLIKKYIGNLKEKKVLVPSSGDNIGAFGFCMLGAKVTSCDIAENQLKNARIIAEKYNIENIEFICQDSMRLDKIKDMEYDLVYTSNGVHVWINDMSSMYRNFNRVLKNGGYNIFFETHPMCRPFDNSTYEIRVKCLYEDIGPHGDIPTYNYRTQDFINAVVSAGFSIKEMHEFHSQRKDLNAHNYLHIKEADKDKYKWYGDTFDWKVNPWAALPQCLCLCSQKI
jgi:ubiquinone/menaquinone biosynthesis C-methylase UbiE